MVHLRAHEAHHRPVDLAHLVADRTQEVEQRPGARIFAHEDPAVPGLAAHRDETELAGVEAGEAPGIGDGLQRPVGSVRPRVVLAGEPPRGAALVAGHRRAAVAARVVEGAEDPVVTAHDDDGCARSRELPVRAGLGPLRFVAGEQPRTGEDAFPLELEERRVGVARRGDRGDRHRLGRGSLPGLLDLHAIADGPLQRHVHGVSLHRAGTPGNGFVPGLPEHPTDRLTGRSAPSTADSARLVNTVHKLAAPSRRWEISGADSTNAHDRAARRLRARGGLGNLAHRHQR